MCWSVMRVCLCVWRVTLPRPIHRTNSYCFWRLHTSVLCIYVSMWKSCFPWEKKIAHRLETFDIFLFSNGQSLVLLADLNTCFLLWLDMLQACWSPLWSLIAGRELYHDSGGLLGIATRTSVVRDVLLGMFFRCSMTCILENDNAGDNVVGLNSSPSLLVFCKQILSRAQKVKSEETASLLVLCAT